MYTYESVAYEHGGEKKFRDQVVKCNSHAHIGLGCLWGKHDVYQKGFDNYSLGIKDHEYKG